MDSFAALRALVERDLLLAVAVFSTIFVVKHTFCIPGGSLLNALGGALFGPALAIPLCAALSAAGGSSCYLVSRACGAPLLERWHLEARVAPLRRRAEEAAAKGSLPRLLISLRLVPLLPQWAVNVAAPHAGIPLPLFAATTAVGLLPYCAATCGAGAALAGALESDAGLSPGALLPPRVLALLCATAAAVAFGPTAWERATARWMPPGVAAAMLPAITPAGARAAPAEEGV